MPERRGIFRRILDRIRGKSPPEPLPAPPQPPEPPPLPPPPPGGAPAPDSPGQRHERRMQEIYAQWNNGSMTEYLDWRDLFEPLEVIFDGYREIERYWDMFLRAFKLTTHDSGHIRRETFYNRTGIPRSEIDWSLWRDIMGYTNRRGH